MKESQKIILVGPMLTGELESSILAQLNLNDVPQIAIDGGALYSPQASLWMGDGDSGKPSPSSQVLKKQNQNETDLRFCLNHIRDWSWSELHLFGFLGGRRDHELANLGEVAAEARAHLSFSKCVFYDRDFKPVALIYSGGQHRISINGLFSILTFEKTKVSIQGSCQFAAENLEIEALSGAGVSNRGEGLVHLTASAPFLLIKE